MNTPETTKKPTTVTTTEINDVVSKYRKAQRRQMLAAEELIEVLGPAVTGEAKVVQPPQGRLLKFLTRLQAKVAKVIPFFPA